MRAQRNRSIKSAVKTKITKFRRAVADGIDGAEDLRLLAVSALDRAVSKGVLHRNNAARRKTRLMKQLKPPAPVPAAEPAAPAKRSRTPRSTPSAEKAPTRARAANKR